MKGKAIKEECIHPYVCREPLFNNNKKATSVHYLISRATQKELNSFIKYGSNIDVTSNDLNYQGLAKLQSMLITSADHSKAVSVPL